MYRKNVVSQSVWAQMNSRSDGTPLTADVSVKVAYAGNYGDGAGTLTHRGGGLWEYVFAQAETNHDQFGYQFNHASGVAIGGTIVPTAANPTDSVRFGLTSLPNAAADAAGGLPISDAGGLDLDAKIGALTFTVAGDVDVNVQSWKGSAAPDVATEADIAAAVNDHISATVATDAGNNAISFKTTLPSAVDDFYNDMLLTISSGALNKQVKKVSDYDGTSKIITVEDGFTGTPADGVTFDLVHQ